MALVKNANFIPLLSMYPENMNIIIPKDTCTPMFIAELFTITMICKQPKCPSTNNRFKRGISLSHKERMPFAGPWMNLELIVLSEVSQTEKDKYHMTLFICRY